MNQQKMKQGLNRRITLVLLSMMILMAAILAVASYYAFRNTYLRFYDEKAQQMVRILVDRTDWERIAHYAETGEKDAYVEDLLDFYDHMKISAYSLCICISLFREKQALLISMKPGRRKMIWIIFLTGEMYMNIQNLNMREFFRI